MEDSVNVSTSGPSGQIVIAGAGYAGLHVTLRLRAKLRSNPNIELMLVDRHDYHQAIPELPPGRRRQPRRRRGTPPDPGHAGQAGPLRPDRDQWLRLARPATAYPG